MKKQFNPEASLSEQELNQLFDALKTAKTLLNKVGLNLTEQERIGMRSISERREGYMLQILRLCEQFTDVLPRNFDEQQFADLVKNLDSWKRIQIATNEANEISSDVLLAMGSFTMRYVDTAYAALQLSRKNNSNLDDAMQSIDNYNKRFGRSSGGTTDANAEMENSLTEDMTANE